MSGYPWDELGIAQTSDVSAIRRAYADRLRGLDLDKDIQGYASLRHARDEALWLAKQSSQEDGNFGLGDLNDEQLGPDSDFSVTFNQGQSADESSADWVDVAIDGARSGAYEERPQPHEAAPAEPELTEAQLAAQEAWQALFSILIPNGQPSDEAVTHDELDAGHEHLSALIQRASESDLVEHDALDSSLAQLFAEAWPRSAPFVEPANQAFHWLDEAGSLEERPALMFLNARLQGMRFHEEVQQEDHPLHKAWVELSRPGKVTLIDRLKIKREEVDQLFTLIRSSYPELESYLDEERVHSWQYVPDSIGPRIVQYLFIGFLIVQFFRFCSAQMDDRANLDELFEQTVQSEALADEQVTIKVQAIFGGDYDMAAIRAADPVFADQMRAALNTEARSSRTAKGYVQNKALQAAEFAEFDEAVKIAELKRLWLTAALDQSTDACRNVMVGDFDSTPIAMSAAQYARESELLADLLNAGLLSKMAEFQGARSFSVPGWMVGEVLDRTEYSEQVLTAALQNPESEDRCQIEITLLGIMLEQPGRVSIDLLRGL
ncbi:MAG: hypothetical protein AAGK02_02795 [Pseudomonadota bacterium]